MSFREDIIARSLENTNAAYWYCDNDFQVMAVNDWIRTHRLPIDVGKSLGDIFAGCAYELPGAKEKLQAAVPYHSTNFELNLKKVTIFMMPLMENETLAGILCCLEPDTAGGEHEIVNSALPVISDKYRSPILNVLNILSALSTKFHADEDYKGLEYLNEAARSCYGMLRGMTSVRNYYQLVNRQMDFQPKIFSLNELLSGICKSLQVLLTSTQYHLELELPAGAPLMVNADEKLLSLAVFQLIANSCTYSPSDSTIRTVLSFRKETAYITVIDEGIGIEQADLPFLFEPFYSRRETPVPEEEMGLGLGLPIAKKIAELHGGSITVTSEKNHGTSVAISLPIARKNGIPPTELHSNATKYVTDRFSDIYIIFSDICKITFY